MYWQEWSGDQITLNKRRNDYYDKLVLYVDDQMLPVWPAFEDRWKLNNKAVPFTNHLMTANIMQPIAMTALFLSQSGNRAHQESAVLHNTVRTNFG